MEIYLFKVKDYTTILVGVYDKENGCMYIQRGDGTKYEYACEGEMNRVVWKKHLYTVGELEMKSFKNDTLEFENGSVLVLPKLEERNSAQGIMNEWMNQNWEIKVNTRTNEISLTEK